MQSPKHCPRWSPLHRTCLLAAALCAGPGLAACDDDNSDDSADDAAQEVVSLVLPVAAGPALLVIDEQAEEALVLDVEAAVAANAGTPEHIERILLPGTALATRSRNGSDAALVLSGGLRGVGQGAVLMQVRKDGSSTSHALGGAFTAIEQSSDGRYAIAYYRQGGAEVVFSPNEFAVVDLDTAEPTAARIALALPGGAPLSVELSPPMQVDGSTYHLAAILSDNHVTLLDLGQLDGPEIVVQLGAATEEGSVTPEQIIFDSPGGRLLIRGSNSDDLFVLTLGPADANRESRLWPSVEVLPAGSAPSDMTTFETQGDTGVVAVSESGPDVRVVMLPGGQDVAVPMDVDANRIAGFSDADGQPQALLYRAGSAWAALTSLDGFELDPAAQTRVLELEQPVQTVTMLPSRSLAIVEHSPALLGLLDLVGGGEQLISAHAAGVANDGTGTRVLVADDAIDSLWVGSAGQHLVGFVVLHSGRTGEVLLAAPMTTMTAVPDAGRLAVMHDDGSITLFDTDSPSRQTAVRVATE